MRSKLVRTVIEMVSNYIEVAGIVSKGRVSLAPADFKYHVAKEPSYFAPGVKVRPMINSCMRRQPATEKNLLKAINYILVVDYTYDWYHCRPSSLEKFQKSADFPSV